MTSQLTQLEHAADQLARYDLARLAPPWNLLAKDPFIQTALQAATAMMGADNVRFPPPLLSDSERFNDDVYRLLAQELGDRTQSSGLVYPSASIAINQVMQLARTEAASHTNPVVVLSNPTIDIHPAFARANGLKPFFVSADPETLTVDVPSMVASIIDQRPALVVLTSPDNPTGDVRSPEDLVAIAEACVEAGSFLLVDHCLAWARQGDGTPLAPNVLSAIPNLKATWVFDSAKILGLQPKLGKVGCAGGTDVALTALKQRRTELLDVFPSTELARAWQYTLGTASLFAKLRLSDTLSTAARDNLRVAKAAVARTDISIANPLNAQGPSLLLDLSDVKGAPTGDDFALSLLVENAVAIVPARVFFNGDRHSLASQRLNRCIRLSMVRDSATFAAGMNAVVTASQEWSARAERLPLHRESASPARSAPLAL